MIDRSAEGVLENLEEVIGGEDCRVEGVDQEPFAVYFFPFVFPGVRFKGDGDSIGILVNLDYSLNQVDVIPSPVDRYPFFFHYGAPQTFPYCDIRIGL